MPYIFFIYIGGKEGQNSVEFQAAEIIKGSCYIRCQYWTSSKKSVDVQAFTIYFKHHVSFMFATFI